MATLRVLGAGSALPRAGFGSAGYLLEPSLDASRRGDVVLLDCGPGTVRALGAAGVALERVRRVVLSHYHLDHCLDLFALAFARRNPTLVDLPELALHGPEGLARLLDEAPRGLGAYAVDPRASRHELALDAEGRGGFDADGLRWRCVRNGHSTSLVSLSWRVDGPGWSLAYTGDTNEDPAVAHLARGVDVLVSECSFHAPEATANHLTPQAAGRLAAAAGAARLVLSHFYPTTDPARAAAEAAEEFDGDIESARDGSVHPLAR